jgi:hypothetical protein
MIFARTIIRPSSARVCFSANGESGGNGGNASATGNSSGGAGGGGGGGGYVYLYYDSIVGGSVGDLQISADGGNGGNGGNGTGSGLGGQCGASGSPGQIVAISNSTGYTTVMNKIGVSVNLGASPTATLISTAVTTNLVSYASAAGVPSNFANNCVITFSTIPTGSGLATNLAYYVLNLDTGNKTFQVSTSRNGPVYRLSNSSVNGTIGSCFITSFTQSTGSAPSGTTGGSGATAETCRLSL